MIGLSSFTTQKGYIYCTLIDGRTHPLKGECSYDFFVDFDGLTHGIACFVTTW